MSTSVSIPKGKHPGWWMDAIHLRATTDLSAGEIGKELGKKPETVRTALANPWSQELLRRIQRKAEDRLVEASAKPQAIAARAAGKVTQRIVEEALTAQKPLEVLALGKYVNDLAGHTIVQRSEHRSLNVNMDARDAQMSQALEGCTDEELVAFERDGSIPRRLLGHFSDDEIRDEHNDPLEVEVVSDE